MVLGLDSMTGLQTARILAARNVPVSGVAADRRHFACRSGIPATVVPARPHHLVSVLNRFDAEFGRPFVVIPCSDPWVTALVASRRLWPTLARAVVPEPEIAEVLMDKARFARFATDNGIPIPTTVVVDDPSGVDEVSRRMFFPVVVKPGRKPPGWDDAMGGKVVVVHNPYRLRTVVQAALSLTDVLVVQEWVPGDETDLVSYNGYFNRQSQPLAGFVARKLRQWPPGAGTSASGEEIRDDEVRDLAVELFQKTNFQGLAYLEVKRHPDGRILVIEPNVGRPTGRSAISEAGGVELVYSAYLDALERPPLTVNRQAYRGVKWVYLRHDVQAARAAVREGTLTWREWWRSLRGPKVFAIWSATDPLPFVFDLLQSGRRYLSAPRSATSRTTGRHPRHDTSRTATG